MQHGLDLGYSRDIHEDQACLTALRADIDRMADWFGREAPHTEQAGRGVHAGQHTASTFPDPGTSTGTSTATVQTGHRPSTRAERRAAALSLIAEGYADREIAQRLGISPTTVGTLQDRDPGGRCRR